MENKRRYVSPELRVFGDVERLTQSGGNLCNDAPVGVDGDDPNPCPTGS